MRVAVYTDYRYRSDGDRVFADKAFALFVGAVAERLEGTVVLGRLRPERGPGHYALPASIRFTPLPWYPSLARPLDAAPALARSVRRLWRVLDGVDGVWVLGPHLLGLGLALLALARRRSVVLGVRQDLPRYVRMRHPGRPDLQLAALVLEGSWRALARRLPVVAVGPDLARRYRRAHRVLEVSVSLIRASDIARGRPREAGAGEALQVLSVGRLEPEKAPLLLADVMAALRRRSRRWRMVVCGEGPLRRDLEERIAALGLQDDVDLRGYVPLHDGLLDLYRDSDVLLHVSLTEGLPQVLHEAFATRTPVVATAVGGVPEAAAGCALLVPPGDPQAAACAVERLVTDGDLRERLVEEGARRAAARTLDVEAGAVAAFLAGSRR